MFVKRTNLSEECTVHPPLVDIAPHGTILSATLSNISLGTKPYFAVKYATLLISIVHIEIVLSNKKFLVISFIYVYMSI